MFAEAAREMLIQNQEQIGMDYNNVMDDGQHDQQMNDYPMCKFNLIVLFVL